MRHQSPRFGVVLYFAPEPADEVLNHLQIRMKSLMPDTLFWPGGIQPPKDQWPAPPFVAFGEEESPLKVLPVPDEGYLKEFGRGVTPEMAAAIQGTTKAVRIVLVSTSGQALPLSRQFARVIHDVANRTEAVVWDSETRECFSVDAWRDLRLKEWTENDLPVVSRQTTVHAYQPFQKSPLLRAITLGMRKFSLPDLVVEGIPQSHLRSVGSLLNLVSQTLVEQPVIASLDDAEFRLDQIKVGAVREKLRSGMEPNATGEIRLRLVDVDPMEGDPANGIVRLEFVHGSGRSDTERQNDLLGRLWGTRDSLLDVDITDEIEAASALARDRLAALGPAFRNGGLKGSTLYVKGPFLHDDLSDVEWMWIEVQKWTADGELFGLLMNDPVHVQRFKAGSQVKLRADQAFDYKLVKDDGTEEGNETGRLMRLQQKDRAAD
ncbi:MAG TPA: hypothetical protein DCY13_03750 [Verrucomicrobiales bacterium]|nr:hypothetical protein [Verrucomicrobiales bacterium]